MPPLLDISSLGKRFTKGGPRVVDGISFHVSAGEIFALLGPSGCGKTTTLRLVAGFERPDSGAIALAGRRLDGGARRVPPEARGIGFVFQDYALFPHLSVADNVAFGLGRRRRSERADQAHEALARVGLDGLESRLPHTLSGGQQQRVALARALAPRPALILLDEPFSNLDAALRQSTRDDVRRILKDAGMSAVLVTHDQEEALTVADRIGVMRDGKIEQIGSPEAVYHRPKNRYVAQFLGRTNLVAGVAEGDRARTPLGPLALAEPARGSVLLSLRPEHLEIGAEPQGGGGEPGTVEAREFRGCEIGYRVRVGDQAIHVRSDHRAPFGPGDRVFVRATEPAVVLEERAAGDPGAGAEHDHFA